MASSSIGVLNNLVTQFASPFDCMRELVQNSIDAGTSQVDVWIEYESGDDGVGAIAIHVDDFGEGMNEYIIDQLFTKLFASEKENDLTKIGKFGIGFVSVFALDPEGVLVHTGRGGEYWEVLFHEDRSFTKTKVDVPIEGTQITIFLKGTPAQAYEVADKALASLKKWCVHAETDITFENRVNPNAEIVDVNEPFGVEGRYPLSKHFDDQSVISVAFNPRPTYAFYNRGLTLAATDVADSVIPAHLAHRYLGMISVKIKSRFLEHTLSRDSVVRDQNYYLTMERLESVLKHDIPNRIIDELETLSALETLSVVQAREYSFLMTRIAMFAAIDLRRFQTRQILRGFDGRSYSPQEVHATFRKTGYIFAAQEPSAVVDRVLDKRGIVLMQQSPATQSGMASLIRAANLSTIWGLLKSALGFEVAIQEHITHPASVVREIEEVEPSSPTMRALINDTEAVLQRVTSGLQTLQPAVVVPRHHADQHLFFERSDNDLVLVTSDLDTLATSRFINVDHEHVQELAEIYTTDRALAVYGLARSYMLQREEWVHLHVPLIELIRREMGGQRV